MAISMDYTEATLLRRADSELREELIRRAIDRALQYHKEMECLDAHIRFLRRQPHLAALDAWLTVTEFAIINYEFHYICQLRGIKVIT